MCVPSSARNQLRGTIETILNGEILSHIVVRVGDNLIESVITRTSSELGYADICVGSINV
jgi:molybdopterin-binding protein